MGRSARRNPAVRAGWLVLAALLLAFAGFEAVKHGGWVWASALAGLALPAAGGLLPPLGRVVLHPLPPLVVLAGFTFLTESNSEAAGGFTFGLTWLLHVVVVRGLDMDRGGPAAKHHLRAGSAPAQRGR